MVELSTTLYSWLNCGFRGVVATLEVVNEVFGVFEKITGRNTIENWVKNAD
jgi:hypothetical protein